MSKGTLKISLRAARINADLTQKEAAERLGITAQTYIKWEQNPSQISALMQDRISEIFDMPMDYINFLPKG